MPVSTLSSLLAAPYGPLNPLHARILARAREPDWPAAALLAAAMAGLMPLSYLALTRRPTRELRAPLAAAIAAALAYLWLNYRFLAHDMQPANCLLSMAFFHLLLKVTELGTCPQIRDSRAFSFPRRVLCAFDLIINLRLFGLGAQLVTPIEAAGSRSSRAQPERHLSHLYRLVPPSRLDAVIGHIFDAWSAYAIASVGISLVRLGCGAPAAEGVFLPNGGAMRAHPGWGPVAAWAAKSFMIPFLAVQLLTAAYHVCAAFFVSTGLWSVESWAIHLFCNPGAADSLLNFWSRRWHQVLRHDFLFLASVFQPLVPEMFRLTLPFAASGAMHAAMGLNSERPPDPAKQLTFFAVHGLGCFIELQYRRLNGRKVAGAWGRVWFLTVIALTANVSGSAWVDAGWGVIVDYVFPPGGTGDKVVLRGTRWLETYLKSWAAYLV